MGGAESRPLVGEEAGKGNARSPWSGQAAFHGIESGLGPVRLAELVEDVANVRFDGFFAYEKVRTDPRRLRGEVYTEDGLGSRVVQLARQVRPLVRRGSLLRLLRVNAQPFVDFPELGQKLIASGARLLCFARGAAIKTDDQASGDIGM